MTQPQAINRLIAWGLTICVSRILWYGIACVKSDADQQEKLTLYPKMIPLEKLPAVLQAVTHTAGQLEVQADGPIHTFRFTHGSATLVLAVKRPQVGGERLTRVVVILSNCDTSAGLAKELGLTCPAEPTRFEFCDKGGRRLDVYAPPLDSVLKGEMEDFLRSQPLAA